MLSFYSFFFYNIIITFINYIRGLCPKFLYNISIADNFSIWNLKNFDIFFNIKSQFLLYFSILLKKHTNFLFYSLVEICCLDFPNHKNRYCLNYVFLSLIFNFRIIVQLEMKEWENILSLTSIYPSAGWLEREVWDMFGVFFLDNKDLRRILTDYGFKYFPLRKDFPLSGFLELRYDDFWRTIVYEPVEFSQEYRRFEFNNSWY